MTTFAGSAAVRIGSYSLEVGTQAGSFAQFEPEEETEHAEALKAALAEEPGQPPVTVAAIEEFQESADAVTGRIEQADKLLRAAAGGELLQLDNLIGEIDGLLDLFARLDKAGRFEEERKLIRSFNGLLTLSLRWLDLVRSLRSLLRSAQAAGHGAGQAWAHHELGSLHLCAGEPGKASEHLRRALRIKEQLGDLAGRCATRHTTWTPPSATLRLRRKASPGRRGDRCARPCSRRPSFCSVEEAAQASRSRSTASTIVRRRLNRERTRSPSSWPGGEPAPSGGGGVDCPGDCTTSTEEGRTVKLRAIAGDGSRFVRWDGVDCGRRRCALIVTGDVTATAVFGPRRPADTQVPTTPTGLRATGVSESEIDLSWSASTDNVGVTGYIIYRNGVKLPQVSGTTYHDTGLAASTGYVYSVQALDAAGNTSAESSRTKAKTRAAPDTEAPSAPTGIQATAVSSSEIDLSWSASTDNVGVTGYVIYRDGVQLTTVPGATTTYRDTGLAASTGYVYSVQAVDAAGNASAQSSRTKANTGSG